TIEVQTGTLSLAGGFSNFAGSTLTGGTYLLDSKLQFTNANIITNAAAIVLRGPASQIVNQSDADALANFASNTAGGSFTIQDGATPPAPAPFNNAATLLVGAGGVSPAQQGVPVPPPDDEVSRYPLDNSVTDSHGLNNPSASNAVSFVPAVVG